MITLHEGKTYIADNSRILAGNAPISCTPEQAVENTITFRILKAHNRSGNMNQLDIQFDSMGIYDNTYIGILQTARASGFEEFDIPCVFTNCHNVLCAVGGTINADLHKYAESACKKYGSIYVPPHMAVIHQYMREMIVESGGMSIVSDSHTRYGTQGSLSIGEGGPELVKTMLGKGYELEYPKVIAVFLKGTPKSYVGPMDVALSIIGKVFRSGFVKNAVLEFVGPSIQNLSMDFRNGIDTMTTESACLSSIWATDDKTKEYFEIHNRPEGYKKLEPGQIALYDGVVEVDLDTIVPSIAMPFHPSNVYALSDVIAFPQDVFKDIEKEAARVFENNSITLDLHSKIIHGKVHVDQGVVAGCCSGSFENLYIMSKMAEEYGHGVGQFGLNIYPSSQPIMYELDRTGATGRLMEQGIRLKSAFCGPCFGAGDTPSNNGFSIRHTTRNFPNREGSNPLTGQIASVALMDTRSITATALNRGILTSAETMPLDIKVPEYHFNNSIYKNTVYNGYGKAQPDVELVLGPDIKDWPEMSPLTEHLLLQVASVIRDEVTTTDELIPSGETASYRSNPYKISEYTLIRKDPSYVGNAKQTQEYEKARIAGDIEKAGEFYKILRNIGIHNSDKELVQTTGIGSLLYAKRPGDGSAREYAASCQKVLGGLANICISFATKRYRSNCVNWGILPFVCADDPIELSVGDYIYLSDIREKVADGTKDIEATVISENGKTHLLKLQLDDVSTSEKDILQAGSLINYYQQ